MLTESHTPGRLATDSKIKKNIAYALIITIVTMVSNGHNAFSLVHVFDIV